MIAWELPTSISVNGEEYKIRTDFRTVLELLTALNDTELYEGCISDKERDYITCTLMLEIMIPDFERLPSDGWKEALEQISEFIDCGIVNDGKAKPRMMDWEQDAPIILPAVNKVAGKDIRAAEYLHWWTFMGYYMEIGECLYSQVLSIRQKKKKGKLEKYEKKWYDDNKALVDLKSKETHISTEEKNEIRKLLGMEKR